MEKEKMTVKIRIARLCKPGNNGLIFSLFIKRKTIRANNSRSFAKDSPAVNGMQLPKQPHSFILPDKKAYPVRKVKNRISNKSNQLNNFICQPSNTATP